MGVQAESSPGVAGARPGATGGRGDGFYVAMALAMILVVLVGFAPSYFLRSFREAPPLAPFLHLHALVFSAWMAVFLAQATFVARGRNDLHRRLGWAALVLAALMVGIGVLTGVHGARGGWNPGGPFADSLEFLVVPLRDIAVFGGFVLAGFLQRRRTEVHRRLMLLATAGGMLMPAITRIPPIRGNVPAMMGLLFLLVAAGPVVDRLQGRRLHPVDLWGGFIVLATVPGCIVLGRTEVWRAFAEWLVR